MFAFVYDDFASIRNEILTAITYYSPIEDNEAAEGYTFISYSNKLFKATSINKRDTFTEGFRARNIKKDNNKIDFDSSNNRPYVNSINN